jgi:hypothetical protein
MLIRDISSKAALMELAECGPDYCERVISWLATVASTKRLSNCDEAIRRSGLRRNQFSSEQRQRIREIEFVSSVECDSPATGS